jgi:hypothetical protein
MKSERRHELEANSLVHEIEVWTEKIKPYTNIILGVVGGLLGLYAALTWWSSSQAKQNLRAWEAYEMAALGSDIDLKEMQRIAADEQYLGTEMQQWAYVAWADRQLLRASQLYLIDREDAQERLEAITGIYQQFSTQASNVELRSRAQLGLGRVYEIQNRLDDAREAYSKVTGPLAEIAKQRAEALDSQSLQEVNQWLATADLPKPQVPAGPGTPGQRPGFGVTSPAVDIGSEGLEGALNLDTSRSLEDILGRFEEDAGTGQEQSGGRYDSSEGQSPAAPANGDSASDEPEADPSPDANAEAPTNE